jgi:hypothetical protein
MDYNMDFSTVDYMDSSIRSHGHTPRNDRPTSYLKLRCVEINSLGAATRTQLAHPLT